MTFSSRHCFSRAVTERLSVMLSNLRFICDLQSLKLLKAERLLPFKREFCSMEVVQWPKVITHNLKFPSVSMSIIFKTHKKIASSEVLCTVLNLYILRRIDPLRSDDYNQ
jgi:hypothetical protein